MLAKGGAGLGSEASAQVGSRSKEGPLPMVFTWQASTGKVCCTSLLVPEPIKPQAALCCDFGNKLSREPDCKMLIKRWLGKYACSMLFLSTYVYIA
jgi:hypothetical protein